jgi:MSHA pilin protein MshA
MELTVIRNQAGFTLIEIIAVLVILGILAAIAIPKYLTLEEEANNQALTTALADGMTACSLHYARLALSNGEAPSSGILAAAATNSPPASTDYRYTFTAGTGLVNINVAWTPATGRTGNKTGTYVMP